MTNAVIQLLVLAGIAVFLILRLRDVLGTREGFEKPREQVSEASSRRKSFEVIEGGPDHDIIDHAKEGSETALALAGMKGAEASFGVSDFLDGARGAYEMILMGFERGDVDSIRSFLSDDVAEAFDSVVADRKKKGLTIDATFVGVRETALTGATFDKDSGDAEVRVKFVGELTSVVRDKKDKIVEGDATKVKRQRDVWTFGRKMGANDPNWQLVATGE